MVRPARLGCDVTITEYADTLSTALNADLPDGEPAWSVVRHPNLRGVLVVEQQSAPPRKVLVWWRTGSTGSEIQPGFVVRSWDRPELTGKRGARRLAGLMRDPAHWSTPA